jgi:hypothetical protein
LNARHIAGTVLKKQTKDRNHRGNGDLYNKAANYLFDEVPDDDYSDNEMESTQRRMKC